jgi:hypothetical protein
MKTFSNRKIHFSQNKLAFKKKYKRTIASKKKGYFAAGATTDFYFFSLEMESLNSSQVLDCELNRRIF